MPLFRRSKIGLIVLTGLLLVVTTAANIRQASKYKNLQVLPQDITEKEMDSTMNAYSKALKVSCDFCHLPAKKAMFTLPTNTGEIDYALDGPMKEEGRKMIRLTMDINKRYFNFDSTKRPEYLNVVHCNTCHRGNPIPDQ